MIPNLKSIDQKSDSWVRSVLEALGDAIVVINADNRILFMNLAAEKLTGVSGAAGCGRDLSEVLHLAPEFGDQVRSDLFSLATIHCASISLGRNLILRSVTGEERFVEGEVAPCQIAASPAAVVSFRDVTDRRRREMAYSRDQKVRTVAQLAGSIAHDLNNALTLILGHTDELARRVPEGDPTRRAVDALQEAGDMACKISGQLRLLSRQEILLPAVLNLNRLIDDAFADLRSAAGDGIEITRMLADDLGELRADPDQVRDMLTNLVGHARSALPEGGIIRLETAGVDFAGLERAGRTRRFIRVRFTYSGPGMKREDPARILEPRFRATPEEAQDLGIFMVLGAVSDAGGHFTADVQPGVSTTFEILFPRLQEAHPIFANLETPEEIGKPTILLVEDDADVRALLSTYFDRSGYRLLEAENGEDALQVSEIYEGAIDLLITDIMMPVMSGPHLVESIAAVRPETRALMISGRPPDPASLREFTRQGVRFLQKPFRSTDLLQLVEQILAESRVRSN